MTNSGEWGMGTMTPASILHADSNDVNTNAILTLENTAGDMQMFRTDATPEGVVTGSVGDLAIDGTNGDLYIKHTGSATNTGWTVLGLGGSSPASNDGAIQYNNGGSFGGDDSNFFWDDTNNRLGLGTNNPGYQLTLVGDGTSGDKGSIELATYADAGAPSGIYFHRSRGTEATPTAITSSLPLGGVVVGGYDGTAMVPYSGGIQMEATENWSNTGHGNKLFFSTTENATTGMLQRMVIMDNGNVGIGTSVPASRLTVDRDAHFNSSTGDYDFQIEGDNDANLFFTEASTDQIGIGTNTPNAKLTINGNLMLADMTAPSAIAGYSGIYSNGGELYAIDATGNSTQLSPHNKQGLWWYNSTNLETGKTLQIEMELLTKKLNKLLGGGYILENGKEIDKGVNILGELSLQTLENINTVEGLQSSVDNNLIIINDSLVNLDKKLTMSKEKVRNNIMATKDNKKDLAILSENIDSLTSLTATLTDTVADHEERIAKIEMILENEGVDLSENKSVKLPKVLKTFTDSLKILEKDGRMVEFTLEGKLVVEEIDAKNVTIHKLNVKKLIIADDDMAGEVVIKKGEKKVKVKFEKEYKSKPYITAVVNNEFILYKVMNVSTKGFEIIIPDEAEKGVEFTWQAIELQNKK
jgi:hypothetical protein